MNAVFAGRSKINQRKVTVVIHQNIVRRDVAVQDTMLMGVPDGLEALVQSGSQKIVGQTLGLVLLHGQQIFPDDLIQRHVGGIVFLEHLMHCHDVRMLELGKPTRLADELAFDGAELNIEIGFCSVYISAVPGADFSRKAFLDHDLTFQAVLGYVCDTKAATLQL